MYKRISILALVALLGAGPSLAQDPAWLETAYTSMGLSERKMVQEELKKAGLYEGSIDGIFGPATAYALAQTPEFLRTHTADSIEVPLDTPQDTARFVRELGAGDWGDFLYGGMAENPAHR